MKTARAVVWSSLSLSLSLCAQTGPPTVGSGAEAADSCQIVERGPHHRVWSKVSWASNPLPVHVKIVIADEDDDVFDSALFIRAKRPLPCAQSCA
jgi:hypothetical protein